MPGDLPTSPSFARRIAAWAVHLLTASGAVWALLALERVAAGDPAGMFAWLGLALVVDGIDGPLARRLDVRTAAPRVDGTALDLIVDYLTYVFVPTAFLWRSDLLPSGTGIIACALILLSSLHLFTKTDMKAADNHFVGFPAVWNLVVLYLHLMVLPAWANLAVVLACVSLTFVPVLTPHPLRVERLRPATLAVTGAWALAAAWLVTVHPARPPGPTALFAATTLWFVWLTVRRSARGS